MPSAFHDPNCLLEHRHHRRRRDVADDQERRVVGTVVRAVERLQIGDGERLDRRRQSVRRRAVAMRRPEDDARERELNQRRRVVARLQQAGQALLAQAIELAGRERRPQRRRRPSAAAHPPASTPAPTSGSPNNRTSSSSTGWRRGTRARRRARATIARAGAFVQHRRREAADAVLADRIGGAARAHDHVDLRERHLVVLDDPDGEAVRQLLLLDRRHASATAPGRSRAACCDRACPARSRRRAARRRSQAIDRSTGNQRSEI